MFSLVYLIISQRRAERARAAIAPAAAPLVAAPVADEPYRLAA